MTQEQKPSAVRGAQAFSKPELVAHVVFLAAAPSKRDRTSHNRPPTHADLNAILHWLRPSEQRTSRTDAHTPAAMAAAAPESSSKPEEESEPECAWCKFMKGGPCREVFEVRERAKRSLEAVCVGTCALVSMHGVFGVRRLERATLIAK